MKPIQVVISEILSPLTYVLNLSISNGIFPEILKIANVIPLYIKDDPMILAIIGQYLYYVHYQKY